MSEETHKYHPFGGFYNTSYNFPISVAKSKILSDIQKLKYDISDILDPPARFFEKWFNIKLPLSKVRVVCFVDDFKSPRELQIRKISKFLTGRAGQMSEEDLEKKGILILPFQYFECTIWDTDAQNIVNYANIFFSKNIIDSIALDKTLSHTMKPPIILSEGAWEEKFKSNTIFMGIAAKVDFGIYIEKDIPFNEIPIKKNTLYHIDFTKGMYFKTVNQFISHIYHKV